MPPKVFFLALIFLLKINFVLAQTKHKAEYKVPVKEKIFGNAWSMSFANTWARNNSFDASIGRTYAQEYSSGGAAGGVIFTTWGTAYSNVYTDGVKNPFANLFIEHTETNYVLGYNARLEYVKSLSGSSSYLVPSIGYSYVGVFDVNYNYSIPLTKQKNIFKGGVSLRVRIALNSKKWVTYRLD